MVKGLLGSGFRVQGTFGGRVSGLWALGFRVSSSGDLRG